MEKLYDCIIVGAGPAGLTAAIYGTRACLDVLLIEKSFVQGGQISNTSEVDNYPGMPGIGGGDLADSFSGHAKKMGVQSVRANIRRILKQEEGIWIVDTVKQEYRAKTIIIASGAGHRHLGIPGEEELNGMGVSYCATCDGAFMKDCVAAVIGGGNTAVEDALYLARVCKKVFLIHRRDELRCDPVIQKAVYEKENVEILWDTVAESIQGEDQVEGLRLRHVKTGEEKELHVDGVFVAVGMTPNTEFLSGMLELDEAGYIVAGEDGITSMPGIFAAGDVRTKKLRQVVTAVSDGANALFSAQEYLLKNAGN